METLSRAYLSAAASPRRPIRVLQIGDGVFLRGFVDWMIDVANAEGVADMGVAVALARPRGEPPKLAAQDGLFTVLERGRVNGAEHQARRIVTAVELAFDPHREPETLRRLAASADLRFVASNTTEAGIVDGSESYDPNACPKNFPSKVAWLLKARFEALGGGGAPGLVFLPCELIEANGRTLRRHALSTAERWGFGPDFLAWVENRCLFLDTLVDRIVPGFPAAEAEGLFSEWGYRDPLAVAAEPFHLWVIEGDLAAEWPLAAAGLNVVWTRDLRPYREAKVRMLNGAHTGVALAAYLSGLDTVGETVGDPQFAGYLERLMFREIAPRVNLPAAEREAYGRTVLERFANPFLRHELIAIALNSISKWNTRLKPTLKDAVAIEGRAPDLVAFSFAALLWFYRGKADRGRYPMRDDAGALALIAAAWAEAGPAAEVATGLMRETQLWGEDLTKIATFAGAVSTAISDIEAFGVRGALSRRGL
jgi:tagaturonate reductase